MHLDAMFPGKETDTLDLLQRDYKTMNSIFKTYNAGGTAMNILTEDDMIMHTFKRQVFAILGNNRLKLSPRKRRCSR